MDESSCAQRAVVSWCFTNWYSEEAVKQSAARKHADIQTIGLQECAWPSCDRIERTVREFKQCSGCRFVWYCSPEHQVLDWGAHKEECTGPHAAAVREAATDAGLAAATAATAAARAPGQGNLRPNLQLGAAVAACLAVLFFWLFVF